MPGNPELESKSGEEPDVVEYKGTKIIIPPEDSLNEIDKRNRFLARNQQIGTGIPVEGGLVTKVRINATGETVSYEEFVAWLKASREANKRTKVTLGGTNYRSTSGRTGSVLPISAANDARLPDKRKSR